jgi:hypothetical protein
VGAALFRYEFDAIWRQFHHVLAPNFTDIAPVVAPLAERRQNLGKIEAEFRNKRTQAGKSARQCIGRCLDRGAGAVFSKLSAAAVRAILMMFMVATPSIMLSEGTADSAQIVVLLALFAAALTFVEYASTYPGLVEFRDAPPFNRVRFLSLFITLFLLSMIVRGTESHSTFTLFVQAIGLVVGQAMDFPYSPVRLLILSIAAEDGGERLELIRATAGMSYLISLLTLGIFVILTRAYVWPRRTEAFNVWVNLPTFDPTAGGDVVTRLERDARVNVILGFLLPFLIPLVASQAAQVFAPIALASPLTLVWIITLWAFLPASLFMRGIAMGRIAGMIQEKRRQHRVSGDVPLQFV